MSINEFRCEEIDVLFFISLGDFLNAVWVVLLLVVIADVAVVGLAIASMSIVIADVAVAGLAIASMSINEFCCEEIDVFFFISLGDFLTAVWLVLLLVVIPDVAVAGVPPLGTVDVGVRIPTFDAGVPPLAADTGVPLVLLLNFFLLLP
jgi:hypothetical protein